MGAKYQFWAGNDVSTIGPMTSKLVRNVDLQKVRRMGTMVRTHLQRVPESFT